MPDFDNATPPAGGSVSAPTATVRLRFAPHLRDLVAGVVGQVQAALTHQPDPLPMPSPDTASADPELLAAWAEGLREAGEHDANALRRVVSREKFGAADLPLAAAEAEALLRASVQVRLRLRTTALGEVPSDEIEGGLEFFQLPRAEQQAYACYRLLAHLEHDLLLQLDPSLAQA